MEKLTRSLKPSPGRRTREKTVEQVHAAAARVESSWETARVVSVPDAVKARAKRLLNVHPLRAADSLQLAAALIAADDQPSSRSFVCLDQRLADAAKREGFTVLP